MMDIMDMLRDDLPVFYQPGKPGIIDVAVLRNGVLTGHYSAEPLEVLRLRYPGAEIGELGRVTTESDAYYRNAPVEITKERYIEMLEVLPPEDWRGIGKENESFKLAERTSGVMTAIFCRLGDRYFELSDSCFTAHPDIVRLCQESIGAI